MPARKVFVSLPGNQSALVNNPPVQPAFSKKILKEEIVADKKDPDLKEEYSESLDDIKKRYSEIYLNRKKKSKWNNNLKGVLQVVAGAAFICVLAVVVYNNFSTEVNKQRPEKSVTKSPVEKKQEAPLKTTLSKQKQIPLITGNDQSQAMGKNEMKTDKSRIAEQEMVNNRNKVAMQKKSPENNPVIEKIKTIPDDGVKKVKETEIIPVIQRSVKKETESSYLRKSVSVSANNYKRRPFGGIMNLQLTITNNSRFVLETVVVELEYMKPSEQPLKTEKIVFNSIAPFGSQTIKVPDFLRGVSVNYKIISIESSMGDKYNAGQ
jgi:hypothetical protein